MGDYAWAGAADGSGARTLGARYVRERRRRAWLGIVAGIAAFAAGFAGFAVEGSRQDELAAHGLRTSAVVTGIHSGLPFDDYLLVGFPTPAAYEQSVHVRAGERLRRHHHVGERIDIVYDPANPRRAQLVHHPDTGPIGALFFLGVVVGVTLALIGVRRLFLCAAGRRALSTPPRPMRAASSALRRGGRMITLLEGDRPIVVGSVRRRDWRGPELRLDDEASVLDAVVDVLVFRDPKQRRVLVVVDPPRQGVAAGREVRMSRALRLLAPRMARDFVRGPPPTR